MLKVLALITLAAVVAGQKQRPSGRTRPSGPHSRPSGPHTRPTGPSFRTRPTRGTRPAYKEYCEPACGDGVKCMWARADGCDKTNYQQAKCWTCGSDDPCNGACSKVIGQSCQWDINDINQQSCCPASAASKKNPKCFGCIARGQKGAQCPSVGPTDPTPAGDLDFKGICGNFGVEDESTCEEFCVKEANLDDSKFYPAGSSILPAAYKKGACCCIDDNSPTQTCCAMCDPNAPSNAPKEKCDLATISTSGCGQTLLSLVQNKTFLKNLVATVKDHTNCDFTAPSTSPEFQACFEIQDFITQSIDDVGAQFQHVDFTQCCPSFVGCMENPFFQKLLPSDVVNVVDALQNLDCNDNGKETC